MEGTALSARALWILSIPLALLAWGAIIVFTGVMPPSPMARVILLPVLALAVTMTLAPVVWMLARGLRLPGMGERPAMALRSASWLGVWAATCAGLQMWRVFNWGLALAMAAILTLLESFLLQVNRQRQQQSSKHRK
jgi:hypothetical protein